jgi:hypothetical protein
MHNRKAGCTETGTKQCIDPVSVSHRIELLFCSTRGSWKQMAQVGGGEARRGRTATSDIVYSPNRKLDIDGNGKVTQAACSSPRPFAKAAMVCLRDKTSCAECFARPRCLSSQRPLQECCVSRAATHRNVAPAHRESEAIEATLVQPHLTSDLRLTCYNKQTY